jgi:hypothetical protein
VIGEKAWLVVAAASFLSSKHIHTASHVHLFFHDFLFFLFSNGCITAAFAATASDAASSGTRDEFGNRFVVSQGAAKDKGVVWFYFVVASGVQQSEDLIGSDLRLWE